MKITPRADKKEIAPSVVEAMIGRATEGEEVAVKPQPKEKPKTEETKPRTPIKPKYEKDRVYEIPALKIKPWAFDERDFEELTYDDNIEGLLQDIRAYRTNQQPILIRPLKKPEGQYDFEEVYGRRRLYCCQLLHYNIRAFVKDMSDEEAFVEQEIENSNRKEVSTWAKAKSYQRALEQGLYQTARELAIRANITESLMSQYVSIYKNMPKQIVEADKKNNWVFLSTNTKGSLQKLIECCEEREGFIQYLIEDIHAFSIMLSKEQSKEKGIVSIWKRYEIHCKAHPDHENGNTKTEILYRATVVSKENQKMFSIKESKNGTLSVNIMKEAKEKYTPEEIMKRIKSALE